MDVFSFVKSKGNLVSVLMSAGTVLAGTAGAVVRGNMEILAASICLLFAVFTQLGANYRHAYELEKLHISSLPRKKIHNLNEDEPNPLEKRVLKEASNACFILAGMLGVTIMSMSRVPYIMLGIGVLIALIIYFLNYKGGLSMSTWIGLLCTFLLFGPIGVMGTCLLQTQYEATSSIWGMYDTAPPIYLAFGMGVLAINIHLAYSYYVNRLAPGQNTRNISSRLGAKTTEIIIFVNGLLAFIIVTYKAFNLDFENPLVGSIPFFLGFMLNTYIAIKMSRSNIAELRHLSMLVVVNYFLTGMLVFILWWILGTPDDSIRVFF